MMRHLLVLVFAFVSLSAKAQHDVPATNSFIITGIVKNELNFRLSDLSKWKQDSIGDVVMKNHKGQEKSTTRAVKGILLKSILDSASITAEKPKEYSEYIINLIASDGYRNVYSWNELFNTETGNHVYVITSIDGQTAESIKERILVFSMADFNSGARYLRGLSKIEVKKAQ